MVNTHIALENVHTPRKTCIPSRFPIENVHTSEVENVHRGVCTFSRDIERFWQILGQYYPQMRDNSVFDGGILENVYTN